MDGEAAVGQGQRPGAVTHAERPPADREGPFKASGRQFNRRKKIGVYLQMKPHIRHALYIRNVQQRIVPGLHCINYFTWYLKRRNDSVLEKSIF